MMGMAFWAYTKGVRDENDAKTEASFPSLAGVLSKPGGPWGVGGYYKIQGPAN